MTHGQEPPVQLDLLEPILRRWVELIGLELTMRIVRKCGGTRLSIAVDPGESSELVQLVGSEAARALAPEFGGGRWLVPKALPALRAVRNAQIAGLRHTTSVRLQAQQHGLGERMVFYVLSRQSDAADQANGAATGEQLRLIP